MPTVLRRLFGTVLGAVGLVAVTSLIIAYRFAWLVVTPPGKRLYELVVRDISRTEHGEVVTLPKNRDTVLVGTYSLVFDDGRGHATIGEVLSTSPHTVTRQVVRTQQGELAAGIHTRFNGWVYAHPAELHLPWKEIELYTPLGEAPAWVVGRENEPAGPGAVAPNALWAIHIHGRAAARAETLRGVTPLARLGFSSIVPSYRNDLDAPEGLHHRYSLGAEEWSDVESAVRFAVEHGAQSIVLYGWSMGGTIALQLARFSEYRHVISAIVLDSPALDWRNILVHHAALSNVTPQVAELGMVLLEKGFVRSGSRTGIPFARLDAQSVLPGLETPVLIMHSKHDGYVPFEPSEQLAQRFPEQVTLVPYTVARHVKLWNQNPERYEEIVGDWLRELFPN